MSADDKTDLDLDALAALEQAATPGPWIVELDHIDATTGEGGEPMILHVMASGVRHYIASDAEGEDAALIAALRNAAPALIEELAHLRRWKAEALPVMSGLQELGRALGTPLGKSITARESVDLALDLRNERDAARAEVAALHERVEAVLAEHWDWKAGRSLHAAVTAALTTGGDA